MFTLSVRLTGSTTSGEGMGDNSLSLPETKRLILRMIQAAALQKALSDDRVADPCPEWLLRRSLCSLPQSNVLSERLRDNDLNTLPGGGQTNVEIVPDNSVILIKKQEIGSDERSEATGEWKTPSVRRSEMNARTLDQEDDQRSKSFDNNFEGSDRIRHVNPINVATTRGQRFFPRFLGKTVLNRPIRVESSRNPSGKRALDCIRKCIVEGGLHPVQCHSIC